MCQQTGHTLQCKPITLWFIYVVARHQAAADVLPFLIVLTRSHMNIAASSLNYQTVKPQERFFLRKGISNRCSSICHHNAKDYHLNL